MIKISYLKTSLFIVLTHFFTLFPALKEKKMVIVVPSYNNALWVEQNLTSLLSQHYSHFRIIYINDCSTDNTKEIVQRIIKNTDYSYQEMLFEEHDFLSIQDETKLFDQTINKNRCFFTLVDNQHRYGAMANFYRVIHSCNDDEIIVTVDGDDSLAHPNVLALLNSTYSSAQIWLTHGRLINSDGDAIYCEPIPQYIIDSHSFRTFKCPSHIRTFYAWLFKQINLEDVLYEGKFLAMTCDMATMYPMVEMAGHRHAFMEEVNYCYNTRNPINDGLVNFDLQCFIGGLIKSKPPYTKLRSDEVPAFMQ